MNTPSVWKRILRRSGIEIKRFTFGLDPLADIESLLRIDRNPVIFDVGANVGQTSLALARSCPHARIFAFEPCEITFVELEKNVAHVPQITPTKIALGPERGPANLKVTGSSVNASILAYNNPTGTDRVEREEEVEMSTLDHFCRDWSIPRISLLKIDTQGFDLEVLRGAAELLAEGNIGAVFVEMIFVPLYEGQAYFEALYDFLTGHQMKFCGLYQVNRTHSHLIQWADGLFIASPPE